MVRVLGCAASAHAYTRAQYTYEYSVLWDALAMARRGDLISGSDAAAVRARSHLARLPPPPLYRLPLLVLFLLLQPAGPAPGAAVLQASAEWATRWLTHAP